MSPSTTSSYGNEPTAPPDLQGRGRAWKVRGTSVTEENASIGADWLVHAPHGHPLWPWYAISGIHLRPLPIKGPPHLQFPGATHEIMFLALNPEKPLPSIDDWHGMAWLEPIDLAHQVIVQSDEKAVELVELVVRHIVIDGANPDQDFRAYWRSAINQTAEHLRFDGHPGAEAPE